MLSTLHIENIAVIEQAEIALTVALTSSPVRPVRENPSS